MASSGLELLLKIATGVLLLPGAGVVATLLAARHYAVRARLLGASVAGAARPGPAVVHGYVDWCGAAESPVEVAIEQIGEEVRYEGKHTTTVWRESRRRVELHAFEIVTPSGARVRVEPDRNARLIDELDEVQLVAPATRQKRALLSQGEEVWIVGAFRPSTGARSGRRQTAFRGDAAAPGQVPASRPLVLREHPLEPMLISARPLESARSTRIQFHFAAALLFAVLTVGAHLLFAALAGDPAGLACTLVAALGLVLVYGVAAYRLVPWYERRRLNEREPGEMPEFVRVFSDRRIASWVDAPRPAGDVERERTAELEAELEARSSRRRSDTP